MKIQQLLTAERARDWKAFVADYVVLMTAKKQHRALVGDYQVKKTAKGYQIWIGGKIAAYEPMDAATLYSWMERLPLRYFALEADNWRFDILEAKAA